MTENLGGNAPFALNEIETPIAYRAGQFFNTSNDRVIAAGEGLSGFVTVTQDNFTEIIRSIAELERLVRATPK